MFTNSTKYIAVCPLTPSSVDAAVIHLINNSTHTTTQLTLPKCYNEAITQSQHITEWWEDNTDYEDPNDKARLLAITEKKARQSSTVHNILFTPGDGEYLCITMDSHVMYFYHTETLKLINVVPFDRKCGLQMVTIDHKNLLISDSVGDIYALRISHLINGGVVPTHVFSHGCLISHMSTVALDTRKVIITGDTEHKIRISNHPHFFDIQSFCYGLASTPYTVVNLDASLIDAVNSGNRVYCLAGSFSGYVRSDVSDATSPFLPAHHDTTTTVVYDPENGKMVTDILRVEHPHFKQLLDDSATAFFSSSHLGTITDSNKASQSQFVWLLPSNVRCAVNERGVSDGSKPIITRSTAQQSLFLSINSSQLNGVTVHRHLSVAFSFTDEFAKYADTPLVSIQKSSVDQSITYALSDNNTVLTFTSHIDDNKQLTLTCTSAVPLDIPETWDITDPSILSSPQQESLARDCNIHFKLLRDERHFKENDEYLERKRGKQQKSTSTTDTTTDTIVQLEPTA